MISPGGQLAISNEIIGSVIIIILIPHDHQPQPFANLHDEQKGKKAEQGRKQRDILSCHLTMPVQDEFHYDKQRGDRQQDCCKAAAKPYPATNCASPSIRST